MFPEKTTQVEGSFVSRFGEIQPRGDVSVNGAILGVRLAGHVMIRIARRFLATMSRSDMRTSQSDAKCQKISIPWEPRHVIRSLTRRVVRFLSNRNWRWC